MRALQDVERLFELYERSMYSLAFQVLNDPWDAEDAVIDAFTRILKSREPISRPQKQPGSWGSARLAAPVSVRAFALCQHRKNSTPLECKHSEASLIETACFDYLYSPSDKRLSDFLLPICCRKSKGISLSNGYKNQQR